MQADLFREIDTQFSMTILPVIQRVKQIKVNWGTNDAEAHT